jgi:hypothetical protein
MIPLLYEENNVGVFLLVTLFLGGGAAWLSGRAIALTWRPWWQLLGYMLALGLTVRFIHYALFGGTLVSPYYYAVDTTVCAVIALLGFRVTRTTQMVTQYRWIYQRGGPFTWRRKIN